MCFKESSNLLFGRKRRRAASALFFISLVAYALPGNGFGIRSWGRRILRTRILGDSSERFLDLSGKGTEASWSKPAEGKSSPLEVRKRVKAVLEKAKSRTGIDNASTKPSVILAEAASIGGIDDDIVIQVKPASVNGKRYGKSNGTFSGFPDEELVVQRSNGNEMGNSNGARKPRDFDVIRGDIPAATKFSEPLPFELPRLSADQIQRLQAGERIQEQTRMGREGSGYVVLDVPAPPFVVWETLLDFESYPEIIPTVRGMQLYTSEKLNTGYVNEKPVLPGTGREARHYGTPSVTRASFILSKFRLKIAAIHRYTPHPEGDYMIFTLDKSCTNMVLKGAKGIWHTQANPDGREGWTRVFLLCDLQISRALPTFIVDYAADRAMPRATAWLRPVVEAAHELWLKEHPQ